MGLSELLWIRVTAKEETTKTGAKVSEKAEEVKAPAVKKTAVPKKAAAKKETAKKETAKKETAVKAEAAVETAAAETAPAAKAAEAKPAKAPAKRAAKKSAEVKGNVTVQFSGKSYSTEELVKIAKDVWKYDLGKDEADFKSVELYVKPEESSVYYVVNGDVTGSFNI